jgi:hypothetical protein
MQAGLCGKQHLVQRCVVILADLVGIGDIEPDRIDIGRVVALVEIRRQVPIGHQVEHADLHGSTPSSVDVWAECYAEAGGHSMQAPVWVLRSGFRMRATLVFASK